MPRVVLKENEVLDDALRRFKRQVSRNGTLAEARKREFYVKPVSYTHLGRNGGSGGGLSGWSRAGGLNDESEND